MTNLLYFDIIVYMQEESQIKFSRKWAMPNHETFSIPPIKEFVNSYLINSKISIDPFARDKRWATHTNDLNPDTKAEYHLDAIDFLKMLTEKNVKADLIILDMPYCYDPMTEILTATGWKYFNQLTIDEPVATFNAFTNKLEYQIPSEIIKKKYIGKMVSIESQSISLLVTPNHKLHIKDGFYKPYKTIDAINLLKMKKIWFQKALIWDGTYKKYFILPSVTLNRHNKYGELYKPNKKIPMDTWLKFLGLFLSEGCVHNHSKIRRNQYKISISQTKLCNLEEIHNVLKELGYHYYKDKQAFIILDKQLWTYLHQFGKSRNKFIPSKIKSLPSKQLLILIKYLMLGDGTNIKYSKFNKIYNKMYSYTTNTYYTMSKQLMNDFSEIALKSGVGISIAQKKCGTYAIHMLGSKDFKVENKNIRMINNYNDYVYCVSVPNKMIIVKRNGRVFICGNSPRQISECYKALGKTVGMKDTQSAVMYQQVRNAVIPLCNNNAIVLSFGWNSVGMGKKNGFKQLEIMLVSHGGAHNDTICLAEQAIT